MYKVIFFITVSFISNVYASELEEFGCEAIYSENSTDQVKILSLPDFRMLDYNSQTKFIELQSSEKIKIKAIRCERSSIIPNKYDYMAVEAGYPFYIVSNKRLIVIEKIKGQYRIRHLKGEKFNQQEKSEISEKLNFFQSSNRT